MAEPQKVQMRELLTDVHKFQITALGRPPHRDDVESEVW